jgi:hypothetical protein
MCPFLFASIEIFNDYHFLLRVAGAARKAVRRPRVDRHGTAHKAVERPHVGVGLLDYHRRQRSDGEDGGGGGGFDHGCAL